MEIALISTTGYSTPPKAYGGEIMVHDLAEALAVQGHVVHLFATFDSSAVSDGVILHPLTRAQPSAESMRDSEYEVIKYYSDILKSVDIVHDFSHMKQVAEYCRTNEIKCISTLWGNTFDKPRPAYNMVCWSVAHRLCGIHGKSGYEGTPFNKPYLYSGSIKDARIVYGGVNTDFYNESSKHGDYLLYVARPHASKGTDIAIELAKKTGVNLILAWRTSSPDHVFFEKKYLEMIKGHENIMFVELPDDETHHAIKRDLMSHAKGFLFPVQYSEAFGLVVAEAMSCGTPVITTDRGSMPELVIDGKTGYICKSENDFINAIRMIGTIKREDCRKRAVEMYDRSVTAHNYVELYKSIINGDEW